MKIAIPSETDQCLESVRSGHFGHCPYFTLVTIEDGKVVSAEAVPNVDHDQYGCGGVIQYAMSLGIDGIIAAGMGMPPFQRFTQGGVAVYYDGEHAMVGDVAQLFAEGKVPQMTMDAVCNHHNH